MTMLSESVQMAMLSHPEILQRPVLDPHPILKQEPVRTISHYSNLKRILLVGEGDFSFASALANVFGTAVNVMATSLDSLDEVLTKYQWARNTLSNLSHRGACLLHNVDVRRMAFHPLISGLRFDIIVWNLPHAGFFGMGETNEMVIQKHKTLLESFFSNASKLLMRNGEVHVSHQSHGPYKKWELANLAQLSGLKLKECVPFHPSSYPGYRNRRGVGRHAAKSFPLGVSETYKFVLRLQTVTSLDGSNDETERPFHGFEIGILGLNPDEDDKRSPELDSNVQTKQKLSSRELPSTAAEDSVILWEKIVEMCTSRGRRRKRVDVRVNEKFVRSEETKRQKLN